MRRQNQRLASLHLTTALLGVVVVGGSGGYGYGYGSGDDSGVVGS
jgi:hypothetical protein